ncbi:TIGR03862 family flavoprotein [Paenirhodobacter enshiensis]|uniref:TIGR03862 family flavoprotein n=1 Tax=Paenirhodobacter enshiensis TaxID=1105367 RepID=UPI003FA282DA
MAGGVALVIGGGPAGLMAAGEIARAGHKVILAEAKPTLARKFLMAGKSGLNLTRDEGMDAYRARFTGPVVARAIADFGPAEVMDFARALGVELFTGTTGRVFPREMKASPMLRAWIARLSEAGVEIRTRWRWTGLREGRQFLFDTPEGAVTLTPAVTVLALGGASWPRLGSDAAWVPMLTAEGVEIEPFRPANMGFSIDWSAHMAPLFGQPVKGVALVTATRRTRGEFVISERGLEGGGIYAVSAELRDGSPLALDLVPDLSIEAVAHKIGRISPRESQSNRLRKALRLDPVRLALVKEWGRPLPAGAEALARRIKALPVPLGAPRPLAEAISAAGGITQTALSEDLELTALPGIFAAGEMLDWEAPTGGYLISGCLATGRLAGRAAAAKMGL